MSCECRVSWPATVSDEHPGISFVFPEGPTTTVTIELIRRSSVLTNALLEGSPCGVDDVNLCLPARRFHDWLECVHSIRTGGLQKWAVTETSDQLISFLNVRRYCL